MSSRREELDEISARLAPYKDVELESPRILKTGIEFDSKGLVVGYTSQELVKTGYYYKPYMPLFTTSVLKVTA